VKHYLLLIAFAVTQTAHCQFADSLEAAKSYRFARAISAPTILIAAGLAVKSHNATIQPHFYDGDGDDPNPRGPGHISDYTQFAPIALVYGLSAFGNRGEHKLLKSTSMLLQSEVLMIAMVWPLKYGTHETRPDGGPHSFPSGHTAQAFLAATFLHKEFGHKSIWYSVGGYTMATMVGTCRMMSNRHWASDVLVGAGIGVLSTNMVYLFHKHRDKNKPKLNIAAAPQGFYMSIKL